MITVGISDLQFADHPDEVLVTYSLGSCVGLAMWDPVLRLGGMLHCMLPLARMNSEGSNKNPHMYADTGIAALLQGLYDRGARRERLVAQVAGGANIMDSHETFRIGERNQTVTRKMLWQNNILIDAEDVGGDIPRTLYLYIGTGRAVVKSGRVEKLLSRAG